MKPSCTLIGEDGNVFNLIGIVSRTLEKNKLKLEAKEFRNKAIKCGSYDEVLVLIQEYVEIE